MKLAAVDLGASGGRVLLGTLSKGSGGAALSMEEVHRFPHGQRPVPHDGGCTLHWDVLHLWNEIQTGLRKCGHEHGAPNSVGVDTWGVDFGLLDRDGALLANPVGYRDAYTEGMVELACSRVGRDELFRRTGLQFMPFNSLFQLLARAQQDWPALPLVSSFLMMPDLFHYWLCGARCVEYTNGSTSQMLGAATRDWDRELLALAGVPDSFLPPLVPAGTRLGNLRPSVAEELGFPVSVPVICPATHDTASAVVATPGEGSDWAFLSAGTWCLFGAEVDQPALDPSVLAAGFGNEGGVRGTTRLLRNITGLWLVQECRRHWEREGRDYTYAELARLAADAAPFVALVDPDDPAFVQPTRMPHAIAEYCSRTGQTSPQSVGEFVRVALEGIALTVRYRWDQLERMLGRKFSVLHIVGGGTQNTLLCQFIANALARPVLAGPVEATAMGNALVQAIGHDALDYAEARLVVRRSVALAEYRPEDTASWSDAYGRFRSQLHGSA
ncbi:MAG: rhamnulokinase [Actinomycetota bacterium]